MLVGEPTPRMSCRPRCGTSRVENWVPEEQPYSTAFPAVRCATKFINWQWSARGMPRSAIKPTRLKIRPTRPTEPATRPHQSTTPPPKTARCRSTSQQHTMPIKMQPSIRGIYEGMRCVFSIIFRYVHNVARFSRHFFTFFYLYINM